MLKFINYFFPRTVTGVMASFQKTAEAEANTAIKLANKLTNQFGLTK